LYRDRAIAISFGAMDVFARYRYEALNIEHPTFNIERRRVDSLLSAHIIDRQNTMFDVGRSMADVRIF